MNRILSRTSMMGAALLGLAAASPSLAEAPAAPAAPAAAPTATAVVTQAAVPAAQDACLDHTVKELGMSAKRAEGPARHWDIAPKFLHGALAKDGGATFAVDFEKADKAWLVKVRAAWTGAPKDTALQLEIEERLRVMTAKMAQLCGVPRAQVECTTTPAGAKPAPCAPPPAP